MGKRPDYATIVYCNLIRICIKNVRSFSAVSKPACGVWHIMITGPEQIETVHSAGFPGRSDFLWNGRALDRGDRRCIGQRNRYQRILPLLTELFIRPENLDSVYDEICLPVLPRAFRQIKRRMRRAFTSSTAIRIHFRGKRLVEPYQRPLSMWYRIRRRSH